MCRYYCVMSSERQLIEQWPIESVQVPFEPLTMVKVSSVLSVPSNLLMVEELPI